ncbi:MAG: hypothetical protein OXU71_05260 [Gammaproteobacteria bacterium]|nr:hypothetical protein [Gammaproteobacteria bacterium]
MNDTDFERDIFPLILTRLGERELHYTKTNRAPNRVDVRGREVYVMTNKSRPNYKKIPHEFFVKTWEILCNHGYVTQQQLSEEYYIKRSAFMLIAFDLLDFVKYDSEINGIKHEKYIERKR